MRVGGFLASPTIAVKYGDMIGLEMTYVPSLWGATSISRKFAGTGINRI